jgi:hypothetical protein
MSERELRDWYAFATERPLPDELADVHSALICSIVANLARGADTAAYATSDFLVLHRPAPPAPAPGDMVVLSEGERFARSLRR